MDVFERLNRKFGAWYEGLFGGAPDSDLRPRDILRRILSTMEDGRREGLDGQVYVPNHYIVDIAVADEDERDYLRTFLDADELAAAVRRHMDQHGYRTRGGLLFEINELASSADTAAADGAGRVHIRSRFDAAVGERAPRISAPDDVDGDRHAAPPIAPRPLVDYGEDDEPGTLPVAAAASVTVRYRDGREEVVPVTARGLQVGRSRQSGNDIIVSDDGMVSKRHVRIERDGDRFVVQDLQSTNGTFVNGQPLLGAQPLQSGDEIRVGETKLQFRGSGGGGAAPGRSYSASPTPTGIGERFRLVALSGEVFPLASRMTVGRALTGDIVLVGERVAPQHAVITVRDDQVFLEDIDTAAGTYVNGERIPARFAVVVYPGDTVAFGDVALRVERGGRAPGSRVS